MSSDITYRHLNQKDYIWAPYAETNYEDFYIMLIAVAGISMKMLRNLILIFIN